MQASLTPKGLFTKLFVYLWLPKNWHRNFGCGLSDARNISRNPFPAKTTLTKYYFGIHLEHLKILILKLSHLQILQP